MLPVQVKRVSSSWCSLSEASALLQRFLSSDACSDSFAREYGANVAQALRDSNIRVSESTGNSTSSPPHSKLHSNGKENSLATKQLVPFCLGDAHMDEKQTSPSAEGAVPSLEVGSREHASELRKKKQRHSAVENGVKTDLLQTSEIEYSSLMHCDKEKRKRQDHNTETQSTIKKLCGPDDQKHHDRKRRKEKQQMETNLVETHHSALDYLNFDDKKRKTKEKQGKNTEDLKTLHMAENMNPPMSLFYTNASTLKVSVTPMSGIVDKVGSSLKKKEKESNMLPLATHSVEKEREATGRDASPIEFQNLDSDVKKKTKKKRRKEVGE